MDAIAKKINARFPHLESAYKREPAWWAWLCIYATTACELLTVDEIQSVVRLSDGYADGHPAIM